MTALKVPVLMCNKMMRPVKPVFIRVKRPSSQDFMLLDRHGVKVGSMTNQTCY